MNICGPDRISYRLYISCIGLHDDATDVRLNEEAGQSGTRTPCRDFHWVELLQKQADKHGLPRKKNKQEQGHEWKVGFLIYFFLTLFYKQKNKDSSKKQHLTILPLLWRFSAWYGSIRLTFGGYCDCHCRSLIVNMASLDLHTTHQTKHARFK